MQNTLWIQGIQLYAYHGCNPEENKIGQQYSVDVSCKAHIEQSFHSDNLDDTIDYADIYAIVAEQMLIPSKLIEHVCHRILQKIIQQFPHIEQCTVKLTKASPPIQGDIKQVAIELTYTK